MAPGSPSARLATRIGTPTWFETSSSRGSMARESWSESHTAATATTFPELYVGERRVSEVGRAFTGTRQLAAPERFTALSSQGAEVEAWIMRPAGFKEGEKYPLLLNIHGGPFTQYGNKF